MFETLFKEETTKINPATLYVTDSETGAKKATDFSYFVYGDNFYVAKQEESGALPTDPAKWSVIVNPGTFLANSDYPFYYGATDDSARSRVSQLYNALAYSPLPDGAVIVPGFENNANAAEAVSAILVNKLNGPGFGGSTALAAESIDPLAKLLFNSPLAEDTENTPSSRFVDAERSRRQKALLAAEAGVPIQLHHFKAAQGSENIYFLDGDEPRKAIITMTDTLSADGKRAPRLDVTPMQVMDVEPTTASLDSLLGNAFSVEYSFRTPEDVRRTAQKMQSGQELKEMLRAALGVDKNTDVRFGSEQKREDIETWRWYRTFREEDYSVRQSAPDSGDGTGLSTNTSPAVRYHDIHKSDYFMMMEKDSHHYLLVVPADGKGAPAGFNSAEDAGLITQAQARQMGNVYCKDLGEDIFHNAPAMALDAIGIKADTKLINISDYELSHLELSGKLGGLNLDYTEGQSRQAKDEYRYRSKIFGDFNPASPVELGSPIKSTDGVIEGDVSRLHLNSLYKTGEDEYLLLYNSLPGSVNDSSTKAYAIKKDGDAFVAEKLTYERPSAKGKMFDDIDKFVRGSYSSWLIADLLEQGKSINNVSKDEATTVVQKLDFSTLEPNPDLQGLTKDMLVRKRVKSPIGTDFAQNLRENNMTLFQEEQSKRMDNAYLSADNYTYYAGKDGTSLHVSITLPTETKWLHYTPKGWDKSATPPASDAIDAVELTGPEVKARILAKLKSDNVPFSNEYDLRKMSPNYTDDDKHTISLSFRNQIKAKGLEWDERFPDPHSYGRGGAGAGGGGSNSTSPSSRGAGSGGSGEPNETRDNTLLFAGVTSVVLGGVALISKMMGKQKADPSAPEREPSWLEKLAPIALVGGAIAAGIGAYNKYGGGRGGR